MYLLLFAFGGLLGAAGVLLAGSGMSLRDGTFDVAILMPGIIAVAGGLLLIGLGGGLRTLQRIERILASRPTPRAFADADGSKPLESANAPDEPARIPFAPKAVTESQPAVAANDIFGAKSPAAASLADKPPVIAIGAGRDASAEARAQTSGKNGNGTGGLRGLRLPARLRPASERQSEPAVDALWPKNPRPARTADPVPVPIVRGAAATPSRNAADPSDLTAANQENATAGISVLKSGVVNGMPYTLYSDGSIEAQLPEGALRFGSITELRNHIEQSA
jgi:hypothetical protein